MKVKLLKDVIEDGRLKAAVRQGRPSVAFVEGAVIEMSDASAKKYVKAGLAEPAEEGESDDAGQPAQRTGDARRARRRG